MRRVTSLLLATSSLVAIADTAPAADLPPRMVTKAPAPAYYNWTGCYLGGHLGWGWGRKDVSDPTVPPFFTPSFSVSTDGFLGGLQGGCDYQINPTWVVGFEGQFSWADLNGSFFNPAFDPFSGKLGPGTLTFAVRTEWIATLTARLGYTWDRWMLYGKGGVAWARDKYSAFGAACSVICPFGNPPFSFEGRETRFGWTLGAGLEYVFNNNWSAKGEYNYLDFGTTRVLFTGVFGFGGSPTTATADIDQRIHTVKIGLNYRWPVAPLVAKY